MRKVLLTSALMLIAFTNLKSQEVEKKMFKINFLLPGVEYEFSTSKNSTININPGFGFNNLYHNSDNDKLQYYAPFLDLQSKWYYNFKKRALDGKNTKGNSADYVAIKCILI
jgi:hypothetical protein